jgi:ATP-dependent helicase YprA (DUF1998 family)
MKKLTLLFGAFLCASMFTFGQVQEGDIKIFQQLFGTEKAAMVKQYMNLTPQQDSLFWKVYDSYETERLELGKRRIRLVENYANSIMSLSADKATEMVNEANAIDVEFKKLQKTYYKKMSKTIGEVKAAQFYQFEGYLNNVINLSIQENIPFVGEIELMFKK